MLTLARCDDRLIHGQCMTVIIKEYDIQHILVVDDFTAGNPILKTVFQTAVPSNMTANVYSVKEAIEPIKTAMKDQVKTLLLMKNPIVYEELRRHIEDLPMELNIGPMSNRKGTVAATPQAQLLPDEAEAIKHLTADGVRVFFRQIPSQKAVEWDEVKDRF
ncbi:PTS transporter subunit IIB [Clostridiaceae bacterium DONG20-135]|uniref:PTS transporter subunit IIB n=1 Tax=Copranaerobaculum intestinale TaxID=2692629 RepID=A0A6N8UCB5_9FIRM|nr:PTS sugar transporter subunit IIB [Copranaerobaculum intestinale]MXQ74353.1 PTS transporter subunit IIB [Copranaerobaculum intestinale]